MRIPIRKHSGTSNLCDQQGFTLLEALIALVVLSVGMLGIAALYVEGLRAGRTAVFRTAAVSLAADLMDRVRANPNGRANYAGAGALNGCVNGGLDCTPVQMAQHDLALWEAAAAARLPAGHQTVVQFADLGATDQYTITIRWPEPGYEDLLQYTLVAQL